MKEIVAVVILVVLVTLLLSNQIHHDFELSKLVLIKADSMLFDGKPLMKNKL